MNGEEVDMSDDSILLDRVSGSLEEGEGSPASASASGEVAAASEPAASAPVATEGASPPAEKIRFRPKPIGVEVGIRTVLVNGQLVPCPDNEQIRVPWMDSPPAE